MIEDEAKRLFLQASELPEAERAAFLADACDGDDRLLRDVHGLLASDARAEEDSLLGAKAWGPSNSAFEKAIRNDLQPGSEVDGYTLKRELGEGGFGIVFLATQHSPVTRTVALKVLKLGMDSRAILARFEAERRILARMEHQNIARILDAGTTPGGRPYFVMEYFNGESITAFARNRQLSVTERLQLFLQACRAVQHAHNRGVIHRDLKPSNVLVGVVDGTAAVKVIDFGVAKAVDRPVLEGSLVTTDGGVIGTPAYMSPEQASGDADIDTRCDVYMLGALLYELLCGQAPFSLEQLALPALLMQIREVDPTSPRAVLRRGGLDARSVPVDLDSIAMRCLEKDRARRYPSAFALEQDVRRFLEGRPVEAIPPSTLYKWRKLAKRHRLAFVSAALIGISTVAGISGLALGYFEASQAHGEMELAYKDAKEEAERARLAEEEAQAQRQVSEDVLSFLTEDVIRGVLPSREPGRGRDVTLREVLEEAARKMNVEGPLGSGPEMSPDFVAKINAAIGVAFNGLGDLAQAIVHTERALELLETTKGEKHSDTLEIASALAEFYRAAGRIEESNRMFSRVMEHPGVLLDSKAPHALPTIRRFAMLRLRQGKHDEASDLIEKLLIRVEELHGRESNDFLIVATSAAIVRDRIGDSVGAGDLFREVYEARVRLEGADSPVALADGTNLAGFLITRGRCLEASELLEDLIVEIRELYGSHETTVAALTNLGRALSEVDRFEDAEDALIEAIEMSTELLGADHVDTLRCESRYARHLLDSGELEEAVDMHASVFERARELFGSEGVETLDFQSKWLAARLTVEADRELTPEFEQLADLQARQLGADDPATLLTRLRQAINHERLGEYEQAEALYLQCLELAEGRGDARSLEVLETKSDLAALYILMGRREEALKMAEQAVEGGRHLLDESSAKRVLFELRYAKALSFTNPRAAAAMLKSIYEDNGAASGMLRRYAFRAACELAELHRDAGETELAAQWTARCELLR